MDTQSKTTHSSTKQAISNIGGNNTRVCTTSSDTRRTNPARSSVSGESIFDRKVDEGRGNRPPLRTVEDAWRFLVDERYSDASLKYVLPMTVVTAKNENYNLCSQVTQLMVYVIKARGESIVVNEEIHSQALEATAYLAQSYPKFANIILLTAKECSNGFVNDIKEVLAGIFSKQVESTDKKVSARAHRGLMCFSGFSDTSIRRFLRFIADPENRAAYDRYCALLSTVNYALSVRIQKGKMPKELERKLVLIAIEENSKRLLSRDQIAASYYRHRQVNEIAKSVLSARDILLRLSRSGIKEDMLRKILPSLSYMRVAMTVEEIRAILWYLDRIGQTRPLSADIVGNINTLKRCYNSYVIGIASECFN